MSGNRFFSPGVMIFRDRPTPMKQFHFFAPFFWAVLVALAGAWGNNACAQVAEQKPPSSLESVVKLFAGSHLLGTGASQFVTSIRVVDDNHAVAIIGETSHSGRHPNAYTVHAKKIRQMWKIVRYEFVYEQTGEKASQEQTPPFPYPHWQKDLP